MSKWYIIFLLPIYNFVVFWIRLAGIINCIKVTSSWRTLTLSEEWKKILKKIIKSDFFILSKMSNRFKKIYKQ